VVEDHGAYLALKPVAPFPTSDLDHLEHLVGCAGYEGPARSLEEMEAAIARGARRRR